MIKEIAQFTASILNDPIIRSFGIAPKEGLHIILSIEKSPTQHQISKTPTYIGHYSKKNKEIPEPLLRCANYWRLSTKLGEVDTNKVLDVPTKAIHTVSPYCVGLKRTNLEGGEQYAQNQLSSKSQFYDRINGYFNKATAFAETDEQKQIADAFRTALNDRTLIHSWLLQSDHFQQLKDDEYVIFYLDLPQEVYTSASNRYLKEKLFNTDKYNQPDPTTPNLIHGTSNWSNGFPLKKPFLLHQTASFEVSGRITSNEALSLAEFSDLIKRKVFPNPLPIFIHEEEQKGLIKLVKEDLYTGETKKRSCFEILRDLWINQSGSLGNYYLLFLSPGTAEIKDFDFVSQFEYHLNKDESPWPIIDLFDTNKSMALHTIEDFMLQLLPDLFNNALIVKRKDKDTIFHWFDDMDMTHSKSHNAFILALKYRKACYDFIYKSKRQAVTADALLEIVLTLIKDDIRQDKYANDRHTEYFPILTKLNILFSLHQFFSSKPNPTFMPDNITNLRQSLDLIATGNAQIESDEQFAFAAGQVVASIFAKSVTDDKSYRYLEPFLSQTNPDRFKTAISNFIARYKHIDFSPRFRNVSADVLTYSVQESLQKLQPIFLAGAFSKGQLYWEKKATNQESAVATDSLQD
jgi:CRISPR-associated protein Csh1